MAFRKEVIERNIFYNVPWWGVSANITYFFLRENCVKWRKIYVLKIFVYSDKSNLLNFVMKKKPANNFECGKSWLFLDFVISILARTGFLFYHWILFWEMESIFFHDYDLRFKIEFTSKVSINEVWLSGKGGGWAKSLQISLG